MMQFLNQNSKMGRKPECRSNRPSFFKVLIGDFSKNLRIPPAFMKHFNGDFPCKSILRSSTGRSWIVKMKKVDDSNLFFHNGWRDFVKDHSLEFGDFLVFRYNGNSRFNVKIYGRSGCEKEIVPGNLKEGNAMVKFSKDHEGSWKEKAVVVSEKMMTCGGSVTPKRRAIIKSERRCFTATCRMSRRYYMTVPKGLAKETGLVKKASTVLRDPCGRSWPVKIVIRGDGRVDLARGWGEFWEANSLVEGDACHFEFTQGIGNALCVDIFRAGVGQPIRPCNCSCVKLLKK